MTKYVDLTGKKYGRLTVLEKDKPHITSGGKSICYWICKCDCGTIKSISSQKLRKGTTVSCGCFRDENMKNLNFEDLTGQRFGRLTVVRYLNKDERKTKTYNWLCKCDCGNYVHAHISKLKSGYAKSCGCIVKEHIGNVNRKYKNIDKRLYSVYKMMILRCYDENEKKYNDYGGRGIVVCEEWLGNLGFDVFSEWAYANGYDKTAERGQCTIDRIDVNGNYEPSNCRWTTNKKQQNNRRNCVYIEHNGYIKTIAEWAEYFGVNYQKAYWHLKIKKRSVQEFIDKFLYR